MSKYRKIEVIDLFCGIGGLSFGMKSKGFDIIAGYDLDATCRYGITKRSSFIKILKRYPPMK